MIKDIFVYLVWNNFVLPFFFVIVIDSIYYFFFTIFNYFPYSSTYQVPSR